MLLRVCYRAVREHLRIDQRCAADGQRVSPEALRALLHEAYAKPAYASAQLPVPCIQLFLSCEDGTLCTLAVGANGRVVLSAHSEGSETASYWNTGSSALYDALLAMIN